MNLCKNKGFRPNISRKDIFFGFEMHNIISYRNPLVKIAQYY